MRDPNAVMREVDVLFQCVAYKIRVPVIHSIGTEAEKEENAFALAHSFADAIIRKLEMDVREVKDVNMLHR